MPVSPPVSFAEVFSPDCMYFMPTYSYEYSWELRKKGHDRGEKVDA
jgi:hypothetical protein